MSIRYNRNNSEQRSLNKLDILLADSMGPALQVPPNSGHYSRRKKLSMSPERLSPVKLQPSDNEEQRIIEDINKLNRIIRFKSQLIKNKFEMRQQRRKTPPIERNNRLSENSKQILLRYQSNYNAKAFQELVDNLSKEESSLEFVSSCFPEILKAENDHSLEGSRRKLNIEKEIKYKSNEVKQGFLNAHHIRLKSELSVQPKSTKLKLEMIGGWQQLLRGLVQNEDGSNLFLYIMNGGHPMFIGYISYRLGTDKEGGEYCINFQRVYVIEAFRAGNQEELIINLFRTLIRSLSEGHPNKLKAYWSIKHSMLKKAEHWGWKMTAFKRKHYVMTFADSD